MTPNLIDELLAEQRCLTPVARFAQEHDQMGHALSGVYRDLIPLSAPKPGEQYAFEVDLDRCTGCKACVAACHSLNGLDESESWREVGRLHSGPSDHPIVQTVTTACHHCEDPGCANGCPVLAYEKDPVTGIVRHLDDQCIGCQYCIMKCPYEVPKYSDRLGIVRKCDMCHSRLAEGEAPACVQACPTSAIAIRIVRKSEVRARAAEGVFLPDSPDPRITLPSTRYVSNRRLPDNLHAADQATPQVQPGHGPLVLMLVFTQAGLGLLIASAFQSHPIPWLVCATFLVHAGLAASIFHLGQPLKAWRAFLGWRKSWLSREIIALGTFGGAAGVAAAAASAHLVIPRFPFPPWLGIATWSAAVTIGFLGVICSAWVYHDTHRQAWRGFRSFGRFLWTTALFALPPALPLTLGSKLLWEFLNLTLHPSTPTPTPTPTLNLNLNLALDLNPNLPRTPRGEGAGLRLRARLGARLGAWFRGGANGRGEGMTDLDRSALLQLGPLRRWTIARFAAGLLAIILAFFSLPAAMIVALAGELMERSLFFKSGVATKMPGS